MRGEEVLAQQAAMNNGAAAAPRRMTPMRDPVAQLRSEFSDATPKFVGGLILGSVATLVLLRLGGFRFSFGGQVGAAG